MTFSEKLLQLRKARGMSQEELAAQLDVSRQAVSRWEMGTAMPDAVNLVALSDLFGVTTDYLLRDESVRVADIPVTGKAEPTRYPIRYHDLLLTVMILLWIALLFAMLFQSHPYGITSVRTLLMLALQAAAVISFEVIFSRRNMPNIDLKLYHMLFYRTAVWTLAYLPICWAIQPLAYLLLYKIETRMSEWTDPTAFQEWLYRLIRYDPHVPVWVFVLMIYILICLLVFLIFSRAIKRHQT